MLIANYHPRIYQGIAPREGGLDVRLVLRPGLNDVDADTFAEVSKQPGPARRIAAGEIGEVKKTSALDPRTATNLAGLTGDLAILRRWQAAEKRPDVATAIGKQIAALEPDDDRTRG